MQVKESVTRQFHGQTDVGSRDEDAPPGARAHPALVPYASAKAAMIGMPLAAADELAGGGGAIRVNVIVPGFFATRLLDESSGGRWGGALPDAPRRRAGGDRQPGRVPAVGRGELRRRCDAGGRCWADRMSASVETRGATRVVRFGDSPHHLIDNKGAAMLGAAVVAALADEAVRAIVLTSTDDIFIRHTDVAQIARAG